METERDISMEIQDIVEDIVGDVLQMADSMETKEGEESSKSTECQHGDPFSRLKLIDPDAFDLAERLIRGFVTTAFSPSDMSCCPW